jgi:protein-disulfide isomerase-like protein with CxxC motif
MAEKVRTIEAYDPSKKYTWTKEDVFELTGAEFGHLLNTFRAILNTEEAARVLMANQANEIVEKLMKDAVAKGVATLTKE